MPEAGLLSPVQAGEGGGNQRFTPEELRELFSLSPEESLQLKQCSRETAMWRAMPVGLGVLGLSRWYMQRFQSSAPGVKSFILGVGAYTVVRALYVPKCMRELRELPGQRSAGAQVLLRDRPLKDLVREMKEQRDARALSGDLPQRFETPGDAESHNQAVLASPRHDELVAAKDRATSHEELRAINRAQTGLLRPPPAQTPAKAPAPPQDPADHDPPPTPRPPPATGGHKGKFGDEGFH